MFLIFFCEQVNISYECDDKVRAMTGMNIDGLLIHRVTQRCSRYQFLYVCLISLVADFTDEIRFGHSSLSCGLYILTFTLDIYFLLGLRQILDNAHQGTFSINTSSHFHLQMYL